MPVHSSDEKFLVSSIIESLKDILYRYIHHEFIATLSAPKEKEVEEN
jgi:hypothetical protein